MPGFPQRSDRGSTFGIYLHEVSWKPRVCAHHRRRNEADHEERRQLDGYTSDAEQYAPDEYERPVVAGLEYTSAWDEPTSVIGFMGADLLEGVEAEP